MLTQIFAPAIKFSIASAKLKNSYFLEHLPVVDSASVTFSIGRTNDFIQPFSHELQSTWLQPQNRTQNAIRILY